MKVLVIVALLLAASEAVRRPIPYEVYVKMGGLPLPEALRNDGRKWYTPDLESNSTGRIVGGEAAVLADAPWIVSLRRTSHFCGGSIYNARNIITAAHCVDGVSAASIQIRYGSATHGSGGTLLSISRIVVHGSYSSSTINNDIAILQTSAAIALSTTVRAVSLPASGSDPSGGTSVTCAGWGTTSEGGSIPASLRKVTVPIVARSTCQSQYGASSITTNMICAGETGGGKDACQGDSGGPLVSGTTLVGVVSWGYGCARPNYAGVYTRVGNYITWIGQNILS
jgi:trypsin